MSNRARWVKQAEAARAVGISPPALSRWIRRGLLTPDADRRVDMERVREIAAQRDPARSPAARKVAAEASASRPLPDIDLSAAWGDDLSAVTFQDAKTMREVFEARAARLRYEVAAGELIDARRAAAAVTTAAANMRLAIEALPDRLAAHVAAESSEAGCAEILTSAIGEVLQALQDMASALSAA
jgi:DNA-binding transcriptional MerR regulator